MKHLSYAITPYQIKHYQRVEERESLAQRHLVFFATQDFPIRLISYMHPFTLAPLRKDIRQKVSYLDDVYEVVCGIEQTLTKPTATNQQDTSKLIRTRMRVLEQMIRPLRHATHIHAMFQSIGDICREDLVWLHDQLSALLWRWRWFTNQRRALDAIESVAPPLMLDHYLLAWPDTHVDSHTLAAMVKDVFLLPDVEETPLPPLFTGTYREAYNYLVPNEAGQPYLTILTAHDIRGIWHYDRFHEVLMGSHDLTLSIDIQTIPRATAHDKAIDTSEVLNEMVNGRYAIRDKYSENAYRDCEYARNRLDTQNLHLVHYAMLIQAPTPHALHRKSIAISDKLSIAGFAVERLPGVQLDYLKLFTPTPTKKIDVPFVRRNTLSESLVLKTPWGYRKSKNQKGILWGYDPHEGMPIYYHMWGADEYQNGHLVMIGQSGAGKTVYFLILGLRLAVDGNQVIFFDPLGKCSWLCEAAGAGGRCYVVEHEVAINILDPVTSSLREQRDHVAAKLSIALGTCIIKGEEVDYDSRDLSNFEKGALDRALQDETIYGPDGCYLDQIDLKNPPLLADLVRALRASARATEITHEAEAGLYLADEIESTLLGSSASIFNKPTELEWNFGSDVIGYDFSGVDKALLPLIYSQGFEALNRWVRSAERKQRYPHVVAMIDEFKYMSSFRGLVSYVAMATKTWRNAGAAIWTGDQNVITYYDADGKQNEWGAFISENVFIKILGKQEGSGADILAKVYAHRLSPSDVNTIRIANTGQFVTIYGDEVRHTIVQPSDLEATYFLRKEVRR